MIVTITNITKPTQPTQNYQERQLLESEGAIDAPYVNLTFEFSFSGVVMLQQASIAALTSIVLTFIL
jgi:hypothetical protein